MEDGLLSVLNAFDGLEYTVRIVTLTRSERYNIKRETEMNRRVETTHIYLNVYNVFEEDGKRYRGSYSTEIHPTATEAEIRETIQQGVYAAGFVKNDYYPLPGVQPMAEAAVSDLAGQDFDAVLNDLCAAFYANDNQPNGNISYGEFFITKKDTRIINSNGVDVRYTAYEVYVETAIHWRKDGRENEITEAYRFSHANAETLKENIRRLFETADHRANAVPTPVVSDIPVLLTGECLSDFFSFYKAQSEAMYIFRKFSTWEKGQDILGAEAAGDRLTLMLEPALPGSTLSNPYDNDGKALSTQVVIKDGIMQEIWGSTRWAFYLQIPPTGSIESFHVTGGTATDEELRQSPYIEVVSFSGFQMNDITGDFGSEIRLGYYHNGETTVPITGGSVSGNIHKVQANKRMSVAERQYNHYRGPATIRITGASVAGVE
jgi:PmbA protein